MDALRERYDAVGWLPRRTSRHTGRLAAVAVLSLVALGAFSAPAMAAQRFINVKPNAAEWTPSVAQRVEVDGQPVTKNPGDLTVRPGDTVTWSFGDAIEDHTVTSQGSNWGEVGVDKFASCDDNADISTVMPQQVGDYFYLCEIHTDTMYGTVKVRTSGTPSPVGASTQGRNTRGCPLVPVAVGPTPPSGSGTPAPGTPAAPTPGTSAPGPPALVNNSTGPAPSASPSRTLVSRVSAVGRRGVVRLRFRLAAPAAVTARIRSVRTGKVVKTVRLPFAKRGLNSHRVVDRRRLKRGRYRIDIAARDKGGRGAGFARKRFSVR